jgi:sulfur-oxidizing protein SoxZ
MTKPRIKLPESAKVGEIIEIKTLISHVMETGQRRGADGAVVARSIINGFTAKYAGAEVFKAELHPGIAANPYLVFYMRVPGPGELELTWTDDSGASISEKVRLNVVA